MKKQILPDHLNICMVAKKFPLLGRAADHGFLWPIARGLRQKGHKVTILSWKNPQSKKHIHKDDIDAYFLGEGGKDRFLTYPEAVKLKFVELHEKNPFHIIHSVDPGGFLIGRKKKSFRVAMAYDVEATQMAQVFSILGMGQETLGSLFRTSAAVLYKYLTTYYGSDRKILKTADGVFVTSPMQKIALERYYLYPDLKIHAIPYGIEIGDLSPKEKSEELRKQLKLPENARIAVTISDMTELREMQCVLKAFFKVAVKKTSARLIVLGNGPLRKQIEYETYNLALGNRVIFTGAVTNIELPNYIGLADVFINLSSRTSGFEPNLLEAMAQKKVIIGSEVSPISTIVEDGKNGFLIRPADANSLGGLLNLIFADQIPTTQIGESARQNVINLFDMEKMLASTLRAYFKTIQRTGFYNNNSVIESMSQL